MALTLVLGSAQAQAQQSSNASTATDNQDSSSDEETSDIVVTGTNISGVKPVGSEAVTLGREEILATGLNSPADVIRTLPQVRNLGEYREGGTQGSANSQQGNAINLRGLGQQATLTLVDGHRLVATGAASSFTEANQVPIAALERIEVIADGASAVYGSDAVAGVVNFVLRKDYDGIEASGRVTNQSGGWEMTPSLTFGKTWGERGGSAGNILISYEYTSRDPYLRGKNQFLRQDLTPFGGPDNRLNGTTAFLAGAPNIYVANADGSQNSTLPRAGANTYYGVPQGANVGLPASALLLNQPNLADSSYYNDYTGSLKRHQVSLYANQELGASVEVYLQGTYWNRKTFSRATNTEVQNVTLASTLFNAAGVPTATPNPYYISGVPGVAPGAPLNVQYSAVKDIGASNWDNSSETYSITGGVRVKLPWGWKGEAYYTYGRDKACNYCQTGVNVNATALQYQINIGAINPLSSIPLTSAQVATFTGDNIQKSGNGIDDAVLKFDGPLFDLPAGTVRAAFGGERNKQYNYNINGANRNADNGFVFDTTEAKSMQNRTIWSAYGELYLPLIGEEMNVPLVRSLTLDSAIRYDDYSDVGSTTNKKFGATWEVNDALSFRGSYGTSFRAPSLPDVNLYSFSAAAAFPFSNYDPRVTNGFLNFPPFATLANGALILGSNPALKPERATNWSFGGDLKLGDFKFNATYYNISYKDRIGNPDALAAYQTPGLYPNYNGFAQFILPINNPTTCSNADVTTADPVLQRYLGQTILYGGLPNFCAINVLVDQRNTNLAATRQDGIDATLSYMHQFGEVNVNASVSASWTLSNDQQVVAGQPFIDRLGYYSTPVEWRGRGDVGLNWRGFNTSLYLNYTGSYTNDLAVNSLGNTIAPQKVGAYVTADLTLGYGTFFEGRDAKPFKSLRGSISIQNLFDRDPPLVITSQGAFNGAYSNPFGRTFTVQLTTSF